MVSECLARTFFPGCEGDALDFTLSYFLVTLVLAAALLFWCRSFFPRRDKIKINVELCKRVDKMLAKTRERIHGQNDASKPTQFQQKIRSKFQAVEERANDLLERCKCTNHKSWLSAAVALIDIKEHVLDIELDLKLCTLMWELSFKSSTEESDEDSNLAKAEEQMKSHYDKLSEDSKGLQLAAKKDKDHLRSKLEEELLKHDKGTEEYSLAAHMQCRLNEIEHVPTADEDKRSLDEYFRKSVKLRNAVGKGGFALVFKTIWLRQSKIGNQAVKISIIPSVSEENFLKTCCHPNIVQYFWSWNQIVTDKEAVKILMSSDNGFSMEKEYAHILMELMPTNLSFLIKEKERGKPPFELPVAIDLMLQIAKAMRYLHGRRKILHRDLKPDNVLVDTRGNSLHVKVVDFGISKVYQHTETPSAQTLKKGTTIYAAPEVYLLAEKGSVTANFPPRADVWSFAITASEILTGQPPFQDQLKSGLHEKIKNGLKPKLPDDLPDYLRFCIESCLNLDPQKRPNFQNICRMLTVAEAVSLNNDLVKSALKHLQKLGHPSSQIASKRAPETRSEIGPEYSTRSLEVEEPCFLVGTSFKLFSNSSREEEILGQEASVDKGITTAMNDYKILNPIQIPLMQGDCWAKQLNDNAFGCLFGTFVSSKCKDQLRELNVQTVTGGYLGETDPCTREAEVNMCRWGNRTDKNLCWDDRVCGFFCQRSSSKKGYVYFYFDYDSSYSTVITHMWRDDIFILGDRGTGNSAYRHRKAMGRKILPHDSSKHKNDSPEYKNDSPQYYSYYIAYTSTPS